MYSYDSDKIFISQSSVINDTTQELLTGNINIELNLVNLTSGTEITPNISAVMEWNENQEIYTIPTSALTGDDAFNQNTSYAGKVFEDDGAKNMRKFEIFYEVGNDSSDDTVLSVVNTISSDVSTINTKLDNISSDIISISSNVVTINDNVLLISSDINNISSDIISVSSNVVTISDNLLLVSSNLNTISADLDSDINNVYNSISAIGNIHITDGLYIGGTLDTSTSGVDIKDIDVVGDVVYIVYKDSNDNLLTTSANFQQDGIIASGVNL